MATQLHRPHRVFVPPTPHSPSTPRQYLPFPSSYPPSTSTAIPPKQRASWSSLRPSKNSPSSLFFLLFSLRSLYTLFPFLHSSSSFSLFPFTFLVSLHSFLFTLALSIFCSSSTRDHFLPYKKNQPIFSLSLITRSQRKLLLTKSALLGAVFLLRFQALSYCGAAAMILAELSGNLAAQLLDAWRISNRDHKSRARGMISLLFGLLILSLSWDRAECFPFSATNAHRSSVYLFPKDNCLKIWPMLLPFVSGFLGWYERKSSSWASIRQLGNNRIRVISLFYTSILLFFPAMVSFLMYETMSDTHDSISSGKFIIPLANTVVFGVVLSENHGNEDFQDPHNTTQKDFLVTFIFTFTLELLYFPDLSLWGLLLCGVLLWISVREVNTVFDDSTGSVLDSSSPFGDLILNPVHHILSERKSRKIALFLAINTAYMVVEFVTGLMSNSLGLISDACHMLFDCAALAIGLYASYISRLPANFQYNYGRGRFEVLSGYVNAVLLVLVGALIVLESVERILEPQEISTSSLLTVSIGGLVVNVVGLIFFHEEHHHAHGGARACSHSHSHSHSHLQHISEKNACSQEVGHETIEKHLDVDHHHHRCDNLVHHHHHHQDPGHDHGHKHRDQKNHQHLDHHGQSQPVNLTHKHIDHNMEGIFLHVLADTMGSVGVVISTLLIKYKGWLIADPASSIFISVLIISSVIPLLRNSAEILLQRVPRDREECLTKALDNVTKVKGVRGIESFHVWSLTNVNIVGTLNLHVSSDADKIAAKAQVLELLRRSGVDDLTLQMEYI